MITLRQRAFVMELLADPKRRATRAAIRAGYKASCAHVIACNLLKKDEIQKAIDEQISGHLKKLEVDTEMVISGIVKENHDAKAAGIGAWQAATVLRGYEFLGRCLGIFTDRVEVNADEQLMERLIQGRKYAAERSDTASDEEPEEDSAGEPKPN
jgi:hypothetical protein